MAAQSVLLIWGTFFLILGLIIVRWIHNQYDIDIKLPPGSPGPLDEQPLVSVIIPARNEARNIRRCVESLTSQAYKNIEIIVIDDRSTDATPEILSNIQQAAEGNPQETSFFPLSIIHGSELPPGWAGKPHALHQGYQASHGDWLCFIDADTFANSTLINSTYQAALSLQADMLTILTYQELGTFWEKVILPLVFSALAVGFPARQVNDPHSPDAIANGQFILIKRQVYQAVGGHAAVRDQIAEDKAIAVLVKKAGYHLVLADGRELARTRMYTSLPEIWEGWVKNIYLGMQDRPWLLLLGAMVGFAAALLLPLWTVAGFAWILNGGGWIAGVIMAESLALWTYLLYQRYQVNQAMEIPSWYALTLPLGALIFTAMMITSVYNVYTGRGIVWKGRTYS